MSLEAFRRDPDASAQSTDFFVDTFDLAERIAPETRHRTGGRCETSQDDVRDGICRLRIRPGQGDYYYPWVPKGVGEVVVPCSAPNRTLVLTDPMNGCSLKVHQKGTNLIFYHDADNNSLGNVVQPEGVEKCNVQDRLYAPMKRGNFLVEQTPTSGHVWMHQIITIKHDGRWKVYNFGFIVKSEGYQGGRPIQRIIRSYLDGITKLYTSFECA